jgi:hypothetical protein
LGAKFRFEGSVFVPQFVTYVQRGSMRFDAMFDAVLDGCPAMKWKLFSSRAVFRLRIILCYGNFEETL